MSIVTLTTIAAMRAFRRNTISPDETVALVPTMGALHAGHASLVSKAKKLADRVIVSIFVNPSQFGANEDYGRYPRTLDADRSLLDACGADAVFVPEASEVFPAGFQTYVDNVGMAADLCGAERPGHFRGVCTIVLKLLQITQPHIAVFGKKDYQQVRVIEQMVADLNLEVVIARAPLKRDDDGLAMSSRNRYLKPAERAQALKLAQGLQAAEALYRKGERRQEELLAVVRGTLLGAGGEADDLSISYLELRSQGSLTKLGPRLDEPAVLLAAIRVGSVRLIDNMELGNYDE